MMGMVKNMIPSIIKKVFQTNEYHLSDLDKGISNRNYLLQVNGLFYVLRVPKVNDIFDRSLEYEVLKKVKVLGIDIPFSYYDIETGIKITPYIEDLQEFSRYQHPSKIKEVAMLIRKLHDAKIKTHTRFNPLDKLVQYQNGITTPLFPYHTFQHIIATVKSYHCEEILCHNDIVSGNLCFTENKTYLIDYEYAGDNDPLFDLMSFITENTLSPEEEEEFLYHYFSSNPPTEIKKNLEMWRNFHNLLWLSWANMMYDKTSESTFLTIAQEKYLALQSMSKHKDT